MDSSLGSIYNMCDEGSGSSKERSYSLVPTVSASGSMNMFPQATGHLGFFRSSFSDLTAYSNLFAFDEYKI